MIRILTLLIIIAGLLLVGCSKKDEEVKALEQEVNKEDNSAMLDSINPPEGKPVEETPGSVAKVKDTAKITPEKAIDEAEPDYSSLNGYVVQIGSYAGYDLAHYMAEKYRKRDYPAFVKKTTIDGQTYYRLRVGVYETFGEAKQIGELLKDRYSANYWVDYNN